MWDDQSYLKLLENCLDRYQSTKYHNQVLRCWPQIKARPPNSANEILNEFICLNRYITIGGYVIQPKYIAKKTKLELKIHNLLNSNNNIGTIEEMQSYIHIDAFIITLLIHAIPRG